MDEARRVSSAREASCAPSRWRLRDAEAWDECPLVGPNVFLGRPASAGVSEAARELTTVAATEEYEGKNQEWTGILEGELAKAARSRPSYPGLQHREIEQAVFATSSTRSRSARRR